MAKRKPKKPAEDVLNSVKTEDLPPPVSASKPIAVKGTVSGAPERCPNPRCGKTSHRSTAAGVLNGRTNTGKLWLEQGDDCRDTIADLKDEWALGDEIQAHGRPMRP